jgi:hypothetical protein
MLKSLWAYIWFDYENIWIEIQSTNAQREEGRAEIKSQSCQMKSYEGFLNAESTRVPTANCLVSFYW